MIIHHLPKSVNQHSSPLNVPRISWGQCQAQFSAQKQLSSLLSSIPEAPQGSYGAQKKPSLAENLSQKILELEKALRASRTELALVIKALPNISETSFNCVYWSSKILNLLGLMYYFTMTCQTASHFTSSGIVTTGPSNLAGKL